MSKPGEKTIQTLLAAKTNKPKDKERSAIKDNPGKEPAAKYKRLVSDRSLDSNSDHELSIIQTDLESIKEGLEGVIKKQDLNSALSSLVQKNDIENIVTNIVNKLVQNMEKNIDKKFKEKLDNQTKTIEGLRQENENLREAIATNSKTIRELKLKVDENEEKTRQSMANHRKSMSEIKTQVEDNEQRIKHAIEKANYNEQYSRKFNIKVMQCRESEGENLRDIFANKIVKEKLGVDITQNEIQAIHRIPGKPGQIKPIIVKLINSDVKSKIMRQKKNLPKGSDCIKLVDDVTRHNMGLIARLSETKKFESVWYFNGSVFGKTISSGKRMKFNLFDDVEERLRSS